MNEPVAWMRKTDITEFCEDNIEMAEGDWIPLYTYPADLTDEEIEDLADKYLSVNYEYGEDIYVLGEVEFARAILRKAQKK